MMCGSKGIFKITHIPGMHAPIHPPQTHSAGTATEATSRTATRYVCELVETCTQTRGVQHSGPLPTHSITPQINQLKALAISKGRSELRCWAKTTLPDGSINRGACLRRV